MRISISGPEFPDYLFPCNYALSLPFNYISCPKTCHQQEKTITDPRIPSMYYSNKAPCSITKSSSRKCWFFLATILLLAKQYSNWIEPQHTWGNNLKLLCNTLKLKLLKIN